MFVFDAQDSDLKFLYVTKYIVVQFLSCVWLFAIPRTPTHQASLSFTISWSLLKIISIESVMPSDHFILCHPLLLLPSSFPSIRVFSKESALRIRWSKYWSFSFSISTSNEHPGLISFNGFPGGPNGKEPACRSWRCERRKFDPWVGKIPWRRK